MVLKSSFKFFWLIFLSLTFSQENIWENAEDFIQSYFEPEEFYSADYVQRIRIIPNGNNENWQQKIRLENDRFKMGWRIDKSSYAEFIQNKKSICLFRPRTTILLLVMLVFKLEILFYLAAITTALNPPGIYYHLEK